ncbi:NAD(P)-binding protein [Phlegmacium glaucopus]|nr:NAD(P)-binding protein [Phlegmacium glaucopus]
MPTASSPLPIGVAAVLASAMPTRTAFSTFALVGRIALVTGGQRGIGLEIALALAEAGAVVYCLDLPKTPDEDWFKVQRYVSELPSLGTSSRGKSLNGRLEYISADVANQSVMWAQAEDIANAEGRLDICVANAGILRGAECLDYPADEFQQIIDVNVNGVLYTAQAAGRQMERLGLPGSIIMIGSMSGSITNQGMHWTAYNTSKAAVLQMARSMACELGPKKIRVNSISPGYIYTDMTKAFLVEKPHLTAQWCSQNPLGRLGMPHELRGVALWLAGDGSTFCTGSDIIVDGGHRAW